MKRYQRKEQNHQANNSLGITRHTSAHARRLFSALLSDFITTASKSGLGMMMLTRNVRNTLARAHTN